jgi:hypothetical protein
VVAPSFAVFDCEDHFADYAGTNASGDEVKEVELEKRTEVTDEISTEYKNTLAIGFQTSVTAGNDLASATASFSLESTIEKGVPATLPQFKRACVV